MESKKIQVLFIILYKVTYFAPTERQMVNAIHSIEELELWTAYTLYSLLAECKN